MNRRFLSQVFSVAAVSAALLLSTNSAKAVLLGYDGFDYTDGSQLAGAATPTLQPDGRGGSGWGVIGWSSTAAAITTNKAGSMSFGALQTVGGKTQVGNLPGIGNPATASSQRMLADTNQLGKLAADNRTSSIWISFLMQTLNDQQGGFAGFRETKFELYRGATTNANGSANVNGTAQLDVGTPNTYLAGASDTLSLFAGSTFVSSGTATPRGVTSDKTVFVLLRLDLDNTLANDTAYAWFNPSLASEPGIGTAISFTASDLSAVNGFRFQSGNNNGSGTNASFLADELRIGTTWANVTPTVPEPGTLAVLGVGLSGLIMAVRRKRA